LAIVGVEVVLLASFFLIAVDFGLFLVPLVHHFHEILQFFSHEGNQLVLAGDFCA
jgi:hypothetical protein